MRLWFRRRRQPSSPWGRGAVFLLGGCSVKHRTRGAARRCRQCSAADQTQVDVAHTEARIALNRAAEELARSRTTKSLASEW